MEYGVDLLPLRKKIDLHDRRQYWTYSICDDIKRFTFHSIMMHTENNMNASTDISPSLLIVFSMFKIIIWYEKNNVHKNFPDALVIKYINCGEVVGCTLNKRLI